MDKKTILGEIKKLINFSSDEEVKEDTKFVDAKANGGEIIVRVEADAFEVGLPLFVVTEEGLVPAPAGEHILEDGTRLVVDEAGVITAVETAEEEVAEEPAIVEEMAEETTEEKKEEELEEEVKEEVKDEKIQELEERIAEIEKMMTEMLSMSKETAKFSASVLDKLDTFVKETPAQLEFKSIKSEYNQMVKDNKENKFSGLESFRNIRKK